MTEQTPGTDFDGADARRAGKVVTSSQARAWFVREVLPLEAMLMRFLAKNWRNKFDLEDFRQEIYAQVLDAAEDSIPDQTKPFVFSVARNLLIDRFRKEQIVPIEAVAELDTLKVPSDEPGPERSAVSRDHLRRLQLGIEQLPPRCREAVVLKRIEGLSRREIAERMNIAEQTVSEYIAYGMRILADVTYGEAPELGSSA
jgi:RNA polymerase sigma-70 factor (ECF subfamily)